MLERSLFTPQSPARQRRSRLEQALAIRDGLLHDPRLLTNLPPFGGSRRQRFDAHVSLPGFECALTYNPLQPDGLPFSLQIWPTTDMADPLQPHRKMLGDKVLHLAWGNSGARLVSLRKPREWVDTMLTLLAN